MKRSDGQRPPLGLRGKLFAYFSFFVLVTVLLLWLFQVVLLDRFYTLSARRRLSEAGEAILRADTEEAEALAERLALEQGACVRLYIVEDNRADTYLSVDSELGCVIHRLSGPQLNQLYDAAEEGEGVWTRFQLREGDYRFAWEMEDGTDYDGRVIDERLVYARLLPTDGDRALFLLIDTSLEPIEGTVSVLRSQLLVLTLVLLFLSALLAYLLSRRIAGPLSKLNVAARRLPRGTYPEDYREDGYREVRELSETLADAAIELGKVETLQRELIANVSHDLRTPLTMIVGYAEVMRDIKGENTPENMQVIIDEAKRLSTMVGDLVALSRYGKEGVPFTPERFSLSDLGREVIAEYAPLLAREGFALDVRIEEGCCVTGDKSRLGQALRNLLDNAVNYSGDRREIALTIVRREPYVRVEVADRGEGIPPEERERIWERYYRAGGNHARSVVGSGLGLSIVRECFRLHGARYGVDSTVGEGSTFWFELPIASPIEACKEN
ncbi:MAG: HAMP domain-containing histidine kinase [Clostridia bacterium]|nr:HAMP domain-containing histidine kinase [Clostridia bacterium]